MFLKKIVLHGFKSFADRTEFEFGPGITSVVGPNGCGKSNLLDALRWVLGEQSARTLRGAKMLDVVFAGSRTRKPSNFAEVELVFDNNSRRLPIDEQEVSVGRVLYASGESEYRLNGNATRLKDVRDLFLDTGVGVDAYSVIEQGRVDALLQASPLERREIFEEAAGISRYRVRRAEAQRKLERSQDNLLRLNDLLDELEKRLRSVKLAAGKARNYMEYDARLRELRAAYSLAEFHTLELARRQADAQAAALQDVLAAKRVDLASRDARSAELERQRQALDEAIQATEAELARLAAEVAAVRERIAQDELRLADLGPARERWLAEAQVAERRAQEIEQRVAEVEARFEALREGEAQRLTAVDELQARRSEQQQRCDEARRALESERQAAFNAARQATLLGNDEANLRHDVERLTAQGAALQARSAEVAERRARLDAARIEAAGALAALEERVGRAAEAVRGVERRMSETAALLERSLTDIGETKEARSALLGRLDLLDDLERRQEGVDAGTRWVLEWDKAEREAAGVLGLAADLLRIDDPRLAELGPVLARFEQHIVVSEAAGFLAALRQRGEPPGPVRVLALDRLPAEPITARRDEDMPGVLARPRAWVRCEPAHERLADHALGRVLLVDALERALALASTFPPGWMFVAPGGALVESDGRLALGAAGGAIGLISRKAEIRLLRAQLDELEARLQEQLRARSALEAADSDQRVQRDALLTESAAAQRGLLERRGELGQIDADLERARREAAAVQLEAAQTHDAAARAGAQIAQIQRERCASDAAEQSAVQRVAAQQVEAAARDAALHEIGEALTAARVEAGRAAERRSASAGELAALRSQAGGLRDEHARALREANDADERISAARDALSASGRRLDELSASLRATEGGAVERREERQTVRRRIESCSATTRQLIAEIDEVEAALRQREVSLREAQVRQEALASRVRDELGLELARLYATYQHSEQDWEAVRAEIDQLRGKIARLGHVNLDAIAELDELTPRFETLSAQRSDLVSAIAQLEGLIAELDQQSRERFAAAFEDIRGHFQELFRKVFGGGKADIVLEDAANPLECGIDIIARPPGKEPQSISLLSGGEKTMTAVALLLAVFRSRPSPFAVLDEVDAALDESNVDRFNAVVQEFLDQSQFVVITHSKRTMQYADVLYGITMEEPGVSKRVAVRLEDRAPTPVGASVFP